MTSLYVHLQKFFWTFSKFRFLGSWEGPKYDRNPKIIKIGGIFARLSVRQGWLDLSNSGFMTSLYVHLQKLFWTFSKFRCLASVWVEILFYQDGVCFMSCSNHCSFSPNRSHFSLGSPKLSRGAHLSSTFVIGLINYSWFCAPRVTQKTFFMMDAKIPWNMTYWPIFKSIA